jgi:tetratricopeptide (TPR) repeat protein
MLHPSTFPILKFAVRAATGFVGHSFAREDEEIISQLTEFFSKLGVVCDSGKRAEPTSVSDKVRRRIRDAEFFIGIFTRRDAKSNGSYSTSSWVLEEKAFAIAEGKKLLLFVEEGVEDIGGIQGDHEYIRFGRENFGSALIKSIDYVLSITSVPLTTNVVGNSINIQLGDSRSPAEQLADLRRAKEKRPHDATVRMSLAAALAMQGDKAAALREYEQAIIDFPNVPELHHALGHIHEDSGDLNRAQPYYEKSLEMNPSNGKFYMCLAKCIVAKSKNIVKPAARKPHLERAKRLLEQGLSVNTDPKLAPQIAGVSFLVMEALSAVELTKPKAKVKPNGRRRR